MSKTGRMQQASGTIEKEVTGRELQSMVMEEDYLYEAMDSTSGPHIERNQTTGDDAYSDGPPVCEVYETIDESSVLESRAGSYDAYRPGSSFTTRATLPPHAKVMMLMKSNTPGEKPRLVKLEPVENPSKPDFRFAFETLRKCVKKSTPLQIPRTRKRRIIQPVVKKNKNTVSPIETRQMTTRSGRKDLKSEPTSDDESIENERNRRPRRAHKAPQRYGDYIDETNRDAARLNLSDIPGFEPEAEEPDEEERPRRSHSTSMRKRSFDENVSEGQEETNEEGEDNENEFFEDEELVDVEGREEEERLNETAEESTKKDENQKSSGGQKRKLQCDRCNRYFANHNSMNAHRFKVHRVVVRASVKCPGCEHRATTIHTLNEHVADEHGIKLQYVKRKFKNTGEFQNYLDDLAVTRNMGFVLHRKSENKRQLYCNRSGAISKGNSLRNRPRKGTAKIGAMCPAHLFYTECDDGSIEVNGQLAHFGHALDPRFVFPATSSEKVSARVRLTRPKRDLLHRSVPVDLQDHTKNTGSDDGSFVNVDNDNTNGFDESRARHRGENEIALEQRYGPLHPNSDEIDIRMKNIDRLCSFLFDNVSEQLYRLNDETMDMVLRALRTTQNSISNLNSMMIQIKEGDPDVVQKFQRRGPGSRYAQWLPSFANMPERVRADSTSSRQQRRQMYDTEDYDEDTVYYRHVPLRTADDYENVYVVDEGQVETAGEVEAGEEYYETY
ncbi:hypothetical protein X798_01327 [Onchocerca flexuosa]|uniref:C2H2-type domain-containing protein n=2 Tax=Onchocerca flexuosa TaxID=387005 RepID=A0A238C1X0_9BILA|nr:hypothetical protein X798_01327 [Onchocerca flexuosa]